MTTQTHIVRRFIAISAIALGLPMSAQAQGFGMMGQDHGGSRGGQHGMHQGGDQHGRGSKQRGGHDEMQRMGRFLNLTEAQRTQMRALGEAQRAKMESTRQALRESHRQLATLAFSDKYTPAEAAAKADALGKADAEAAKQRAEGMQKMYQLLTPEQKQKVQAFQQLHAPAAKPVAP